MSLEKWVHGFDKYILIEIIFWFYWSVFYIKTRIYLIKATIIWFLTFAISTNIKYIGFYFFLEMAGSKRRFGRSRSSRWRITCRCRASAGELRRRGPREGRRCSKWGRTGLGRYKGRIGCPLHPISTRVQALAAVQRF